MDVEARVKAVEERLSEVEVAHRGEAEAIKQLFDLCRHMDGNIEALTVRVTALETNFSLVNAAVNNLAGKVEGLEQRLTGRVDNVERKIDQVLELLRHSSDSQPH